MLNNKTIVTKDVENRELVIERSLDAPRDLVWQGWTMPEHISKWWGPAGWVTTIYKMDVKPGGIWHYCMRPAKANEPAGKQESWGLATYREVINPERLAYTDSFSDKDGNIQKGTEMPTTVDFADLNNQTKITVRTQFATVEQLESAEAMGMVQGFSETLDRLEKLLINKGISQ